MAIGQSPKDNSRCAIEKAQVQAAMRLLEGKKKSKTAKYDEIFLA